MKTEGRPLVLIGDDDKGCRRALSRMFRGNGFDVLMADSLAQIQQGVVAEQPDAMVIEYAFPDGRTVDFLQKIRSDSQFIAIVMLTGTADVEAAADVLSNGLVDRFLTKPWDDDWLLDVLKGVLREKALRKQNLDLLVKLQDANARLEEKIHRRTLQLERAKREWEMTFDSIDEPLFIVESVNMTIQRANRATARLLKRDIRDLAGHTCHKLFMGSDNVCDLCPVGIGGSRGKKRVIVNGRTFDAGFFRSEEDNATWIVHMREVDA